MYPLDEKLDVIQLEEKFTYWYNLCLKTFEESHIFDDQILHAYYEELEPNFEFQDQDADVKSFNTKQQDVIINFLTSSINILSKMENSFEALDAVRETEEAIKNVPKEYKSQVFIRIRKFIAKSMKVGFEVGQKVLVDFTAAVVSKMLTS